MRPSQPQYSNQYPVYAASSNQSFAPQAAPASLGTAPLVGTLRDSATELEIPRTTTKASTKRKLAIERGITAGLAVVGAAVGCGLRFGRKSTNGNTTSLGQSGSSPSFAVEAWPNVGFGGALISGQKVVALTFDDGPAPGDANNNATEQLIDVLEQHNLPATFFVCNKLWTDVATNPIAQGTLQRIVNAGFGLGSHTLDHQDLSQLNQTAINQEFAANEVVFRQVFGPDYRSSLVRAPYGRPYQTNSANVSSVAPIQMPFGVHVGWGIDTDDWKCAQNGMNSSCILNNLEAELKQGASGPILMHAVYDLTVETLPAVIDMLGQYGRKIVGVEDLVAAKYQHSSKDVMSAWSATRYGADAIGQSAVTNNAQNINVPGIY